jgi:hypothetical protein
LPALNPEITKKASGLCIAALLLLLPAVASAQVRGVYPLGMTATNSGVTPEPGFSYVNQFLIYTRDELKGPHGEVQATGQQSVVMDMNSLVWVSKREILGAKFSMSATLPFANNSLESDADGYVSGGGGFADSYYQPFILGWETKRVDVRAIYGFLAPTGRFHADANDNVGSGYWTHVGASGQTVYLSADKATAFSAFQMYEFHTTQEGTGIHPGQTFDLDYSLTHTFSIHSNVRLQAGLVGYSSYQTTDKTGPTIAREQEKAHYRVSSLGFTTNFTLPAQKLSLGFKYFSELSGRSTFQGYSAQISGSIRF